MALKTEAELKEIENHLVEMGQLVRSMHVDIKKALEIKDSKLALDVIKRDEVVNNLDEMINEKALALLATQAPVARDLRSVIAMIRTATDLERIGDYAKSIGTFIILSKPLYIPFKEYIDGMFGTFIEMYDEALSIFIKNEYDKVTKIVQKDQLIDNKLKKAWSIVNQSISQNDLMSVLDTFSILRIYERAGDHTKNICEAVIFKVKGKKIDLG
jgi:phosphate transport system protein